MSNLVNHARCELTKAGLFSKESDYEGMLGPAVMALVRVFAKQGHSGFSASLTRQIFDRVANFKTLSPLTDSPAEWMLISRNPRTWQSRRQSSCFSEDGGKTYHDIDHKPRSRVFKSKPASPAGGGK